MPAAPHRAAARRPPPPPSSNAAAREADEAAQNASSDEESEDLSPFRATRLSWRKYGRRSARFLVGVAVPYCLWRTSMETVGIFAFKSFQRGLEADFLGMLFRSDDEVFGMHLSTSTTTTSSAATTTNDYDEDWGVCGGEEGGSAGDGACASSSQLSLPSSSSSSSSAGLSRLEIVGKSDYTVTSYTDSLEHLGGDSFDLISRKLFPAQARALSGHAHDETGLRGGGAADGRRDGCREGALQAAMRLAERRCAEKKSSSRASSSACRSTTSGTSSRSRCVRVWVGGCVCLIANCRVLPLSSYFFGLFIRSSSTEVLQY